MFALFTFQPNPMIKTKSVLKRPKANVLVTVVTHKDQAELPLKSLAKFPLDWVSSLSNFFSYWGNL